MATPLVNGDIVRVIYGCFCPSHNQQGLMRLYYKVVEAGAASLDALPDDLYQRMRLALLAWLPSQAQFVGVSAQRVSPKPLTPTLLVKYTNVAGITGVNGSGILPLQTSGLISHKSESYNVPPVVLDPTDGRTYVPFPAIASNSATAAKLSTAGVAKLITVGSLLGPSVVYAPKGLNMQLVIARTTNVGVYSPVQAMTFHESYATQRRRGDFGKINIQFGGVN